MYKNMLPIGSVVLLKEGKTRLMICGRIVTNGDGAKIYDYVGCLFPQGIVNSSDMYFFDREAIQRVFFIGMQDEEELAYEKAMEKLGELEVVDGRIVEKNISADNE